MEQAFLERLESFGFYDTKERFLKMIERKSCKVVAPKPSRIIWERFIEVHSKEKLFGLALTRYQKRDDVSVSLYLGLAKHTIKIPLVDVVEMQIDDIFNSVFESFRQELLSDFKNPQKHFKYERTNNLSCTLQGIRRKPLFRVIGRNI